MRFACVALCLLGAAPAYARRRVTTFEPTDLSEQEPGKLELDLQTGATWHDGSPAHRISAPDFELNLGLMRQVELDLDGAFFVPVGAPGALHADDLWTSLKVGIATIRDQEEPTQRLSVGMQLGPRLPFQQDSRGLGYSALFLAGYTRRGSTVAVNAGFTAETEDRSVARHAMHADLGLDLNMALNGKQTWALLGELGGSMFVTRDPHDVHATVGVQSSAWAFADLSLVAYGGPLAGTDRAAILLGFNPHFRVWR